jgi:carbohydrate diacid regulator
MLTEKRMQKILDKLVKSIQVETDILDANGTIIASSDKSRIGEVDFIVKGFVEEDDKALFIDNDRTFMKFTVEKTLVYFLSMVGTNRVTRNYCLLTVSLIDAFLKNMVQKMDKEEVMRRILLDQLGELEMQELVRDYKLELGLPRCVYIIRTMGMEADNVYQMLIKAFPRNQGDVLVLVDSMTVSLVKALPVKWMRMT